MMTLLTSHMKDWSYCYDLMPSGAYLFCGFVDGFSSLEGFLVIIPIIPQN